MIARGEMLAMRSNEKSRSILVRRVLLVLLLELLLLKLLAVIIIAVLRRRILLLVVERRWRVAAVVVVVARCHVIIPVVVGCGYSSGDATIAWLPWSLALASLVLAKDSPQRLPSDDRTKSTENHFTKASVLRLALLPLRSHRTSLLVVEFIIRHKVLQILLGLDPAQHLVELLFAGHCETNTKRKKQNARYLFFLMFTGKQSFY